MNKLFENKYVIMNLLKNIHIYKYIYYRVIKKYNL